MMHNQQFYEFTNEMTIVGVIITELLAESDYVQTGYSESNHRHSINLRQIATLTTQWDGTFQDHSTSE